MRDRYDVVDLEPVPGGWRACGHRIDETGASGDQLFVDLERVEGGWRVTGHRFAELGRAVTQQVPALFDGWESAVDALHHLHPDVPNSRRGWSEVTQGRWQWAHQRHHDRPGSARNPHRLEIRMPVHVPPGAVHVNAEPVAPVRRRWGWALAMLAGMLVGAGLVAALAWYYAGM